MPGTSPPTAATVLRSLVMPIYLPALAVQTGTAMLLPILPLYLRSIELSYSSIAWVLAAAGVGAMVAQLPFGHLLARRPEQVVMLASVAVMAATTGVFGWIEITAVLLIARLLWGVGSTGWLLSRQTVMTRATSSSVRGRAMSLFGGTTRLGFFIGPVLGGFAVEALGYPAAFLAAGLVTALGMLPLLTSRQPLPSTVSPATSETERNDLEVPDAVEDPIERTSHWPILVPMGIAQILVIAARQGRQIVIPLIGEGLGLDPGDIGLLVGIGTFTDFLLFPIAGYVMDRFGRLAAVVPAFSLVGIGLIWLATVDTYAGVAGAAALIGVGNSFGSGTMLTLSSDIAPPQATSQFLGTLGAIRDFGKIVGPIVVGVLADTFGLGASSAALGVGSFIAVAIFVFGVGETSQHRAPKTTPRPVA
ncbi:MAG: MFS transporter [Acidimicrobiales bacterium]